MIELRAEDVVGRKVVIVGERGVGKTRLTAQLLELLVSLLDPTNVTVIDMAPTTITGSARLSEYTRVVRGVRYLAPAIVRAPRLEGRTAEEVIELAEANRSALDPLLDLYLNDPTPALVINDLTIYLHAGNPEKLLRCMLTASTFIANAYRGSSLTDDKGSGVTERERKLLDELLHRADVVIALNPRQLTEQAGEAETGSYLRSKKF